MERKVCGSGASNGGIDQGCRSINAAALIISLTINISLDIWIKNQVKMSDESAKGVGIQLKMSCLARKIGCLSKKNLAVFHIQKKGLPMSKDL